MTVRTITDLDQTAKEDQEISAIERNQRDRIARIRELRTGGMSRARLIQTYGQDVVDIALAEK